MKTNIRIDVTQEHLNLGRPNSNHDCPIALAFIHAFPCREVQVETHEIYSTDRYGNDIVIPLPLEAQNFIERFDASERTREWVRPFALWLQVPEEFLPSPRSGASEVFFN